MNKRSYFAVLLWLSVFWFGCASTSTNTPKEPGISSSNLGYVASEATSAEADTLWKVRTQDTTVTPFPLGPGDLLTINAPGIREISNLKVRVSPEHTITLPLLGVVNIRGETEAQIHDQLLRRLGEYLYTPEVDVFVTEYHSRIVAVAGMVQKPAVYTLATRNETLSELINRAGGMTEKAASQVILVPSTGDVTDFSGLSDAITDSSTQSVPKSAQSDPINSARATKAMPMKAGTATDTSAGISTRLPRGGYPPVFIDLANARSSELLNLPARPGDAILVPASGEVMVQGWVANPGAFNITPGMTVLGAITAAGGQMFSSSAELLRKSAAGAEVDIPLDLSKIRHQETTDPAVQSGDVIIINRSVIGAAPYLVYSIFNHFSTGIYPAAAAF